MWVEMKVSTLAIDPQNNMPLVLLENPSTQEKLPIFIGVFEASAIALELEGIKIQRPMTHDLLRFVIEGLGGKLKRIEICDLKDNTFFANLILEKPSGGEALVDARPSDAVALALRLKAPILVDSQVLAKAKTTTRTDLKPKKHTKEEWEEILKNLADDEFGKYKM
jgi:uncharacterized protein